MFVQNLVKRSGVDENGHAATEAGCEEWAAVCVCVVHDSRAPPVPAHHVPDSTDLLAKQTSACVCVCVEDVQTDKIRI